MCVFLQYFLKKPMRVYRTLPTRNAFTPKVFRAYYTEQYQITLYLIKQRNKSLKYKCLT